MDNGHLKETLVNTLKSLPPQVRDDTALVMRLIARNLPWIMANQGALMDGGLRENIQAIAVEFAMGMVDTDGLDRTLVSAFAEAGVALPQAPGV